MTSPILLEAGLLSVEFHKTADRYAHQVFTGHGGQRRLLLESVEGGGDDPWPHSPPLQELHVERQADGRQVALLVGRAGRSHWSLSVEPCEIRLVFDAACRFSGEAEWLGSSYRAAVVFGVMDGLATFAGGTLRMVSAEVDGASLSADADVLQIRTACRAAPGPRTARWRYMVEPS